MTASSTRPTVFGLAFTVVSACSFLAAHTGAQTPIAAVQGIDAHVIFVQATGRRGSGWKDAPTISAQTIRRFEAAGRHFPETRSQSFGRSSRILRRLEFERRGQKITINWTIRTGSMTASGGGDPISEDARGDVVTFDDVYTHGRRGPQGLGYRYVLMIPWTEAPEFQPWTPEAYTAWLVNLCIDRNDLSSDAARALMRIPTQSLLDVKTLARLRGFAADWEPDGNRGNRRNRGGRRFNQWGPTMRPADIRLGVRLAAGDPDALDALRRRGNNWMLGPSMILAYVQSGDPTTKGELGWAMADPGGDANLHRRDFIVPYFEAVEAGKAIIPGSEEQRAERHGTLARLVAETDPTGALLVMLGAGAALVGVAFAARRLALKLAI